MSVDIVLVTYNRLDQLKHTLNCWDCQTVKDNIGSNVGFLRNIIVVNNCSTDGTKEFLEHWKTESSYYNKILINTNENLGGSGGFYLGQKKALELEADWIMVADDDAYPAYDMMENFLSFVEKQDVEYSAVCAKVMNEDGSICITHRTKLEIQKHWIFHLTYPFDKYEEEFFKVDTLSYVGSFMNVKALKKYGLVNPNYFIYYDDTEHSIRLNKYGDIVCVPSISITHAPKSLKAVNDKRIIASWKDYYYKRNELNMILKHFPKVASHYIWRYIKDTSNFKNRNHPKFKLYNAAFIDAILFRLGKHTIYKPGFIIEE